MTLLGWPVPRREMANDDALGGAARGPGIGKLSAW